MNSNSPSRWIAAELLDARASALAPTLERGSEKRTACDRIGRAWEKQSNGADAGSAPDAD